MRRPESETTKEYLKWLNDNGIWSWRANSGKVKVGSRYIQLGPKGHPDIAGVLPDGVALFVENKSNGSLLTPEQEAWLRKAQRQGAYCIVAHSLEDIVLEMESYLKKLNPST